MDIDNELYLFTRVTWRGKECVVTNAFACGGKKVQISPMGNGKSEAKYYNVHKNEVTKIFN